MFVHDTEQPAVLHVTSHDAAPMHETLPPEPSTVTVQVALCSHVTLPDAPTVTLQLAPTQFT